MRLIVAGVALLCISCSQAEVGKSLIIVQACDGSSGSEIVVIRQNGAGNIEWQWKAEDWDREVRGQFRSEISLQEMRGMASDLRSAKPWGPQANSRFEVTLCEPVLLSRRLDAASLRAIIAGRDFRPIREVLGEILVSGRFGKFSALNSLIDFEGAETAVFKDE